MRGLLALVLLAGCEQLFQVGEIHPNDGRVVVPDVPPGEAGPFCPMVLGVQLPCVDATAKPVMLSGALDTGDPGCANAGGVVVHTPSIDLCVIVGSDVLVTAQLDVTGPRMLALVSGSMFRNDGLIDASSDFTRSKIGPGAPIGCTAPSSNGITSGNTGNGGAGGSYQQMGAAGGKSNNVMGLSAAPGMMQPPGLRGGCAGGLGGGNAAGGGQGGGAVAIVAHDTIVIAAAIVAGGSGGRRGNGGDGTVTSGFGGGGGGAGGTIILHAPAITIAPGTIRICANGGGGGGGGGPSVQGNDGEAGCNGSNGAAAGGGLNGGDGSTYMTAAVVPSPANNGGGGGGGGAGYVLATVTLVGADISPQATALLP